MSNPAKDLTGQVFGHLTVLTREGSKVTSGTSARALWKVRCVCGTEMVLQGQSLRNANRPKMKSCGCRHGKTIATHNMTKTRQWTIWRNMRSRCNNPSDKDWANYGGRGIKVCPEWDKSFEVFWADMSYGYSHNLTIERKDVNGNYPPANCQWATRREQGNNTRLNVIIQTPIGQMTIAQAARVYGLKPITIYKRKALGWPDAELIKPVCSM